MKNGFCRRQLQKLEDAFAYFYQKEKRARDILHGKKWRRVMFLRYIGSIEIFSKLRIVYSTRNGPLI